MQSPPWLPLDVLPTFSEFAGFRGCLRFAQAARIYKRALSGQGVRSSAFLDDCSFCADGALPEPSLNSVLKLKSELQTLCDAGNASACHVVGLILAYVFNEIIGAADVLKRGTARLADAGNVHVDVLRCAYNLSFLVQKYDRVAATRLLKAAAAKGFWPAAFDKLGSLEAALAVAQANTGAASRMRQLSDKAKKEIILRRASDQLITSPAYTYLRRFRIQTDDVTVRRCSLCPLWSITHRTLRRRVAFELTPPFWGWTRCPLPFKLCSACRVSSYCSHACQTLHWPEHRQVCQVDY